MCAFQPARRNIHINVIMQGVITGRRLKKYTPILITNQFQTNTKMEKKDLIKLWKDTCADAKSKPYRENCVKNQRPVLIWRLPTLVKGQAGELTIKSYGLGAKLPFIEYTYWTESGTDEPKTFNEIRFDLSHEEYKQLDALYKAGVSKA